MAALSQDALRTNYGSNVPPRTWMAAKNQTFYQGSIVLVKSDGFAYVGVAYATASAGFVLGVAAYALDTTADASDGDSSVIVTPGTYGDFDNSSTACAEVDRGKTVYLENDNTISLTSQGGALTAAGRLENIADDGSSVVVQFEVIR
jgi:hypothetical protein